MNRSLVDALSACTEKIQRWKSEKSTKQAKRSKGATKHEQIIRDQQTIEKKNGRTQKNKPTKTKATEWTLAQGDTPTRTHTHVPTAF